MALSVLLPLGVKFLKLCGLSVLSGLLLYGGWPPEGHFLILFIGFVPFFLASKWAHTHFPKKGWVVFAGFYTGFLVWNALTTWWIWNSSNGGAVMAIVSNALLMTGVFFAGHKITRNAHPWRKPFYWIALWLAFEHLHHRWDLTWPWLTLGNALSGWPSLIQWYEFTGTAGGSLWILAVNYGIYNLLEKIYFSGGKALWPVSVKTRLRGLLQVLVLILVPVIFSRIIAPAGKAENNYGESSVHVVFLQPNFDPYNQKFEFGVEEQMEVFLKLALPKIKPETRFLVFPETAFQDGIYEDDPEESFSISIARKLCARFPNLKIIAGASTWKKYASWETPPPSARKYADGYYDAFNSALYIDSTGIISTYHKSKLVPGVEQMPYPAVFGFLESLAIDMGGTSGTLGTQDEREVFRDSYSGLNPAPVICYESVFGEFVGDYLRKGANAVFIMTNDGWWGNTPGYKQHKLYGTLRAIEYRVPVIRCTNTGVSCEVGPDGSILQESPWWEPHVLEAYLPVVQPDTFYFYAGDYLGRGSVLLLGIFLMFRVFRKIRNSSF
jgi:apolipoprotein N-acyltransferase